MKKKDRMIKLIIAIAITFILSTILSALTFDFFTSDFVVVVQWLPVFLVAMIYGGWLYSN